VKTLVVLPRNIAGTAPALTLSAMRISGMIVPVTPPCAACRTGTPLHPRAGLGCRPSIGGRTIWAIISCYRETPRAGRLHSGWAGATSIPSISWRPAVDFVFWEGPMLCAGNSRRPRDAAEPVRFGGADGIVVSIMVSSGGRARWSPSSTAPALLSFSSSRRSVPEGQIKGFGRLSAYGAAQPGT